MWKPNFGNVLFKKITKNRMKRRETIQALLRSVFVG